MTISIICMISYCVFLRAVAVTGRARIYLSIYLCISLSIYIYRERERIVYNMYIDSYNMYVYIYIYIERERERFTYIYIYIYNGSCINNRSTARGSSSWPARRTVSSAAPSIRSAQRKGIWRQGVVLKHRSSLEKSLCPVVISPYLCSSDGSSCHAS